MSPRSYRRTTFTFVERAEPDRRSVEEGLEILAHMIAQAYARDVARNGQGPYAASAAGTLLPKRKYIEEERDAVPKVPA